MLVASINEDYKSAPQKALITIKPIIIGWSNYFHQQCQVSLLYLDNLMYPAMAWAKIPPP